MLIYIVLSIVFLLTRYTDIKEFIDIRQQSQLQRAELIYQVTIQKVKKFYITRGYANIHSFGISNALKNNDSNLLYELSQPRWNIIKKENPYLKSFSFYSKNGTLLISFGKQPKKQLPFLKNKKESYGGFWFYDGLLDYYTITQARDQNGKNIGYVVFSIDPSYFLFEIKKAVNIDAFLVYKSELGTQFVYSLPTDNYIKNIIESGQIEGLQEISIGNGFFLPHATKETGISQKDNFQLLFLQDVSYGKEMMQKSILQSIGIVVVLIFITALIINYGFDIILKRLYESNKKLLESQNELQSLNKNLQTKIEEEIRLKLKKEREANEKERLLVHQSKLASMGEMIGNIAHQWRQPLTELSSILINLQLSYERNQLQKEKFQNKMEEANNQITFMSKTIDDFRNFFKSDKAKEEYKISRVVDDVEKLMGPTLKNNSIELKISIRDDFTVYGYANEISQALLNIVNNAKDIIVERAINSGYIHIETFFAEGIKTLIVYDNAGGISIQPIEKIFEPYISTKHAKSGTGIGLYMTKTIVEKNNDGFIKVYNAQEGAVFTLYFP